MAPTPFAFALPILDGPTPNEVNQAKQTDSPASSTTSSLPSATATSLQTASATGSAAPISQNQACGTSCGIAIGLTLIGLIILGFLAYMVVRSQKKLNAAKAESTGVPEIRISNMDSETGSVWTAQTDLKSSIKEIEKSGKKVWRWGGGKK